MKVERIHHVAILVKDLEQARKFFTDLFNTEFREPVKNKGADVSFSKSPIGINLVAPLSPDGPSVSALNRRGEGIATLALSVPNLEEAIADMESRGVRLIGRADPNVAKSAYFHPKDTYGVMVELMEG